MGLALSTSRENSPASLVTVVPMWLSMRAFASSEPSSALSTPNTVTISLMLLPASRVATLPGNRV
ncbi:hypothetical protein D3C85_1838450 [compost metagenome]